MPLRCHLLRAAPSTSGWWFCNSLLTRFRAASLLPLVNWMISDRLYDLPVHSGSSLISWASLEYPVRMVWGGARWLLCEQLSPWCAPREVRPRLSIVVVVAPTLTPVRAWSSPAPYFPKHRSAKPVTAQHSVVPSRLAGSAWVDPPRS